MDSPITWLAIACGGAVGALLRFLTNNWVNQWFGKPFPYGVLAVNILGSFLIGLLMAYFMGKGMQSTAVARGLVIGVLGAFTTFSTFSLDTFLLLEQGRWLAASANVVANVVLCLLAVWLGMWLARFF